MKKPTAADIAAEFTLRADSVQNSRKYPRCYLCKIPQEIQDAIPLCLENGIPMSFAELARQIGLKMNRSIHPQSVQNHYFNHMKRSKVS